MKKILSLSLATSATLMLNACSSFSVDDTSTSKEVEYQRAQQAANNLEIPPDLTSGRMSDRMAVPDSYSGVSTSYSEYVADRKARGIGAGASTGVSKVLPQTNDVQVQRDGKDRWLVVQGSADAVWEKVLNFWQEQGILLVEQDPVTAVMRTGWVENKANISSDFITDSLKGMIGGLYETGLRDQYRVRLENAGNGVTEVFLTHFGMQEIISTGATGGAENAVWTPRERDTGLEAEMLRRMMVFMGTEEEKAVARLAARGNKESRSQLINTQDGVQLNVSEQFSRSWRLVGLALDRVGFAVEDRDRSAGIYYVRYMDPAGDDDSGSWFSGLKFWGDDDVKEGNEYQVRVVANGGATVVLVMDDKGSRLNNDTAKRILKLIDEQVR